MPPQETTSRDKLTTERQWMLPIIPVAPDADHASVLVGALLVFARALGWPRTARLRVRAATA